MAKTHCAGCENHCITINSLKTDIQSKEEKILKLTSHVHQLETDAPTTNKKRCYDDVGKDDIDEAMMADSADKDIIIKNLKKEIEAVKVIAKTAEEDSANKNIVIESLKEKEILLKAKENGGKTHIQIQSLKKNI